MNLYANIANKVALLKRACQLLIWIKRTYRIETFIEVIVLRFRKETLYRNAVQRFYLTWEWSYDDFLVDGLFLWSYIIQNGT